MILKLNNLSFNIAIHNDENKRNKIPIIFLHGFTGNVNDWNIVVKNIPQNFYSVVIDLIGHGKSSSPKNIKNYTLSSQLQFLKKIISRLELNNPVLAGYSMGGRLSLAYALENKNNVKALVLESTSFGYKTETEKTERIAADKRLAGQIKNSTLKDFFDFWYGIDLFKSLNNNPNIVLEELKNKKVLTNNKTGLINSLLGFGTGTMDNYLKQIAEFNKKVLLITGSLDKKFTQIAKEAYTLFPNAKNKTVNNCGHNVHLEKPEEFLKFLNEFLLNVQEE